MESTFAEAYSAVGGTQDPRLFDRHSNKVSSLLLHLVLQGLTNVLLIYSIYLYLVDGSLYKLLSVG